MTITELDQRLAWATREQPGATALLEHILGAEAAHKLERRIDRRVRTSGLVEMKTLEGSELQRQVDQYPAAASALRPASGGSLVRPGMDQS